MRCPNCNGEDFDIFYTEVNLPDSLLELEVTCNSCGRQYEVESDLSFNILEEIL